MSGTSNEKTPTIKRIINNIVTIDATFLLNFSLLKGGLDLSEESSFRNTKLEFIGLDWEETIDRFHLPAPQKNNELNEFVAHLREKYG